jgi:predicted HAD superfamily Cof-like phosphohydrolase
MAGDTQMTMPVAEMIGEFHAAMGDQPHELGLPNSATRDLRLNLIREEFFELVDADEAKDIISIADALADIVYVAYGTAYAHGIDLDKVLAEVHRSNMTKDFTGPAGDRKAKKGADYQAPNIARVLGLIDPTTRTETA